VATSHMEKVRVAFFTKQTVEQFDHDRCLSNLLPCQYDNFIWQKVKHECRLIGNQLLLATAHSTADSGVSK
jgi:hypothetical protein